MRYPTRRYLIVALFISFQWMAKAQIPILTVAQKETKDVFLQSIKINVQVTGNIATTVMEMVFKNNSSRVLEGELVFPLPENVSVSRYAIDINGKMREAVPVDKAKGTQVFESIERRRVDPGLMEKVEGNNFRTRIYPIPANGIRTVLIGYEEELTLNNNQALTYKLALDYKTAIPNFSLKATVFESTQKPELEEQPDGSFSFQGSGKNYMAEMNKSNFQPDKPLVIDLPKSNDMPEVLLQPAGDNYYFLVNDFPCSQSRKRIWSNHLGIIWDVSLSGLQRDHKKELALLDAIIQQKQNLTIELGLLNNRFIKKGNYTIVNGNWKDLKQVLQTLVYDGGTDFSSINPSIFANINLPIISADEYLFFTDGLSTFGEATVNIHQPLNCINAAVRADYSMLKYISQKNAGQFINLNTVAVGDAVKMLSQETLQFMGIKTNDVVSEVYPSMPIAVNGHVSVAGIMNGASTSIVLQYGYGQNVILEKTVQLKASEQSNTAINISRVWAQKKIGEMDVQYEKNKEDINLLGKQFGIITRNTSLIVLETLNDYIQYEIEPPVELRGEYDKTMANKWVQIQQRTNGLLNNALSISNILGTWWNTEFVVKKRYPTPDKTVGLPAPPPPPSVQMVRFTPPRVVPDQEVQGRRRADQVTTARIRTINQAGALDEGVVAPPVENKGTGSVIAPLNGRVTGVSVENKDRNNLQDVVVVGYGTQNKSMEMRRSSSNQADMSSGYVDNKSSDENKSVGDVVTDLNAKQITINTLEFKSDKAYMQKLTATNTEDAYQQYLILRKDYITTPLFYYDVANWFYQHKDSAKGLLVLSNIADLELENAQLYKLMAYTLKQVGQYKPEIFVTNKVLQWRPMEAQSYRDYALALADGGYYQQALDTLYSTLTQSYSSEIAGRAYGMEEVIVSELNDLIALHGQGLNTSRINLALIHPMPVDVRVVINWNMNDTDIDLWVTDPNDEKCFYSHTATEAGGRISHDITTGYGPEQFMLKKAIKGKYKIQTNYFGDRQINIAGSTAVMAEIYTRYASGLEQRKVISLQMPKDGKDGVLIGEFSF